MEHRLQLFLEMEQLSQSQFAEKMGIQRSGVTHLLSGRNKPSFDFIAKMLQTFPDLSPEWLILGKGKPYKDTTDNQNIATPEELPITAPETDLFDDYTEFHQEESHTDISNLDKYEQSPKKETSTLSNNLSEAPKAIEAILILYKDGTYERR